MNLNQKIDSIGRFVGTVKPRQRLVFSNESNLRSPKDVDDVDQKLEWQEKPEGLWYSHGSEWPDYLYLQMKPNLSWSRKRLAWITNVYELKFNRGCMLRIRTIKEFRQFEKTYASEYLETINWKRVAKDWCGIDIPFILDRSAYANKRVGENSYWNWDVGSGCVWRRDAVKEIKLIKSWRPSWSER